MGATPSPGPGVLPPSAAAAEPMADNVACALCYVLGLVTGVLFLLLAPYNQKRTIRFHAFQSIFLHVGIIIVYIVCGIIMGILFRIVGFGMAGVLWPLFGLASIALWIYMVVSAYQGKTVVLPIVGPLAQQQA